MMLANFESLGHDFLNLAMLASLRDSTLISKRDSAWLWDDGPQVYDPVAMLISIALCLTLPVMTIRLSHEHVIIGSVILQVLLTAGLVIRDLVDFVRLDLGGQLKGH